MTLNRLLILISLSSIAVPSSAALKKVIREQYTGPGKAKIAISIDDVPNTRTFQSDQYRSILLGQLDVLKIPVAIFVNEGLLYNTDATSKNLDLLAEWAKREYITLGNHTYAHSRYSEAGYEQFKTDVEKGQNLLQKLASQNHKPLDLFRFPYNDLGLDSIQHNRMDSMLRSANYRITPFTVESSDWMFNAIYEHYCSKSEFEKATEIGELYVSKTIEYVHFFDSLSNTVYGRNVNQIYLCHDNALNAAYLKEIVETLAEEGYQFVSMHEAMEDPVYEQENRYYQKWGISWLYRWMSDRDLRRKWMKSEPDMSGVESLFNGLGQ